MTSKRLRFCLFCHQVGITVKFPSGNALRKHVKTRHSYQLSSIPLQRNKLRQYRRDVLLAQLKLGIKDTK